MCVTLEKEYADEIDRKLDNGDASSGSIRGITISSSSSASEYKQDASVAIVPL